MNNNIFSIFLQQKEKIMKNYVFNQQLNINNEKELAKYLNMPILLESKIIKEFFFLTKITKRHDLITLFGKNCILLKSMPLYCKFLNLNSSVIVRTLTENEFEQYKKDTLKKLYLKKIQ